MTTGVFKELQDQREREIDAQGADQELQGLTQKWFDQSCKNNYSVHFDWMSRPIVQYPQDMIALQEIIWCVKPDLIIECGIAHGGSLVYSASILAMLDYCEAAENNEPLNPHLTTSKVLGIDIDIRSHNRAAIDAHPLKHKIEMIEASSIEPDTIAQVKAFAANYKNIMVILDSHHSHDHVLAELNAYAELTAINSYCIVFDTVIEDMPAELHDNRPWGPGNSPKSAVWEFMKSNTNFEIDQKIDSKLLISVAPEGYLKKVS